MPEQPGSRIAVVGGGIAGLAALHELERLAKRSGHRADIDLYEAADRLGGTIRTVRDGPYLLDVGPDSLLTSKPWAIELCEELGLESELIATDETHRGVALYSRGKLRRLRFGSDAPPMKMVLSFLTGGIISWPGLLRMAGDFVIPQGAAAGDESIADFFRRRLGREAVERLIDPFMAGIYGGDANRLSLPGTFPRFVEMQERHRSLLVAIMKRRAEERRQGPLFKSLRSGLGQLIEALTGSLEMTTSYLGTAVSSVRRVGERYVLDTAAGARGDYSAVILAVPAHVAASLTSEMAPDLSAGLGEIRYVSSATVFLAFRLAELKERPRGHGFLIPLCEGRRINGATWVSNKYPGRGPEDAFLVRCFVGGDRTPVELGRDDEGLARTCVEELREIAGIRARPIFTRVFRWERSNPQYDVGHAGRLRAIENAASRLPGFWLAGAAYRGIGIPDCVRDGREAGRRAFEFWRQFAAG
ncbi:MAG: protoporphyrinogen oxidase [Gemmatimonadota bacterium]|nr:protoporphyrinogen oxidase [Candidatus Palauibacterales bacterium]